MTLIYETINKTLNFSHFNLLVTHPNPKGIKRVESMTSPILRKISHLTHNHLLAMEVTPGLQQEQSPTPIS
jgi:hypothetical protein